jgi:hypothetical protein
MKVYQADQKIPIDPLYLKAAMPPVILPVQEAMVAIVTLATDNPNQTIPIIITPTPLAVQSSQSCFQLTTSNLNHLERLKIWDSKLMHRDPLEWHYVPDKDKVISIQKFIHIHQSVQTLLGFFAPTSEV